MAARRSTARRLGRLPAERAARAGTTASAWTPSQVDFIAPTALMTWLLWREALLL